MCGIIGILNADGRDSSTQAYTALLALQHRGQDSCGIISFDGSRLNLKKGVGLVSQVFSEENLLLLKGSISIGQVRYSTVGGSLKRDAQPFNVSVPVNAAMAHNGNVVNYDELKAYFGPKIESGCDVEVILHVFAEEYAKTRNGNSEGIFQAVKRVFERVNGAYSVVTIVENGLLAFRDPKAIRPLVMGKSKDGKTIAFASETVALDALKLDFAMDIPGGEAVFIDLKGKMHEKKIDVKPAEHCMFEYVYFSRPDSQIDGKSVYETRLALGKAIGERLKDKGDVVVAVPDTARPSAYALANAMGIPNEEGLIKNRYVWRTFIMPTQKQRDKAIGVKLNVNKPVVNGKKVILVDDSIVRGTTSRKIVRLVKEHAKSVHFVSTCPPIINPCYYGVDFPDEAELIAHTKSTEEIRKELDADQLTYATVEDLKKAIGVPLCTACLTGEYPTKVTEEYKRQLRDARRKDRDLVTDEFKENGSVESGEYSDTSR
ncbi:TPA: amidophosphoribosyltransferase [Candidatus Micrarchaeota archaeon]|nr:amidophosphoribosyltransferase [Candidatus Micrarchaeota archaeon]